jgi:hypothetical protein
MDYYDTPQGKRQIYIYLRALNDDGYVSRSRRRGRNVRNHILGSIAILFTAFVLTAFAVGMSH